MNTISRRKALIAIGSAAGITVGTGTVNGQSNTESDKDEIIELGEAVTQNGAREVATKDNYAFVASGALKYGNGFTVIDWSTPRNPEIVTKVDVPGPEHSAVDIYDDILAVNNDAFHSDKVDKTRIGAHFYDISNPKNPVLLGSFDVNPSGAAQLGAHNLFVYEDTAYLTKFFPRTDSELILVDISDPSNPTEFSRWDISNVHPDLANKVSNAHQVYVEDNLAYIAHWDAGCRVLDVSDPQDPVEITSFGEAPNVRDKIDDSTEFKNRFSRPPGNVHSVRPTSDGNFVVLGIETGQIISDGVELGDIEIWDVTDFDDPVLAARIDAPDVPREDPFKKGGTAHNFDIQGDVLHSSWYAGGVRLHDISDPYNPVQLDRFDPEGTSVAYDTVVAQGRYTLATRRTESLVVLDTKYVR